MIGSIIYYLVLALFLGFLIDLIVKEWKADFLEKVVIRLGAGTAFVAIIGAIFNFIMIPLDWKIFLFVSIIIFAAALYFRKKQIISDFNVKFEMNKNSIYALLVLIMFFITAHMYIGGSFNYPWFEDGDPYGYAMASKYIAEEKTYTAGEHFGHYIEPYTQGYQVLFGVLHQTNDSIYWNMKFFNALIISFSILWFYYFARRFTKNKDIALISTFALFAVPCWTGHFVFSLNFNMALFPLFLYALVMIDLDSRWKYIAGGIFGSILVSHASTAVSTALFFIIYYLNKVFVSEELKENVLHCGFIGFVLSLVFYVPTYVRHVSRGQGGLSALFGFFNMPRLVVLIIIIALAYMFRERLFKPVKRILQVKNIKPKIFFGMLTIILLFLIIPKNKLIHIEGTGTRAYVLKDFFIASKANMINNPIGVGIILMGLFVIGMIFLLFNYKKLFKSFWMSTSLIWSISAILMILGVYFSIVFVPFRMWTYFAVFVSLVVGFVVFNIMKLFKSGPMKFALLVVFVLLVIPTSFSQKYHHNTAIWPEHKIMTPQSQQLYIWMRENLDKDSRVINPCHQTELMYGYDMFIDEWNIPELIDKGFYKNSLHQSLEENIDFYRRNNFEYVAIGASCMVKKVNQTLLNKRVNQMVESDNFRVIHQTQTEVLFKVI